MKTMKLDDLLRDDPELHAMYYGNDKVMTKEQKLNGWQMAFRLGRRLAEWFDDLEVIAEIIANSPLLQTIDWDAARWLKHKDGIKAAVQRYRPTKSPTHADIDALICEYDPPKKDEVN